MEGIDSFAAVRLMLEFDIFISNFTPENRQFLPYRHVFIAKK